MVLSDVDERPTQGWTVYLTQVSFPEDCYTKLPVSAFLDDLTANLFMTFNN